MSFSEAPTQLPLSSQTWPALTGDQLTQRGESMTMCGVAFALGKVNDTFLEMRVVVVSSPKPTQRIIETLLPRRFSSGPRLAGPCRERRCS
jgi:hypothetical protein